MLNGLYASASALNLNLERQDAISHNLAHLNVPGFKRVDQAVHSFQRQLDNALTPAMTGAEVAIEGVDFSQGRLEETGLPLNVAIDGDGFFVVQGELGPLYTRNGNFKIDTDGQITLPTGEVLESDRGPIRIPANTSPESVNIGRDGTVTLGEQQLGQLRIVQFPDNQALTQVGTTLFSAPENIRPEPAEGIQVHQRYLESSNAQAVSELIHMIAGMRHFEAAQRAMRAISEAVGQHADPRTA